MHSTYCGLATKTCVGCLSSSESSIFKSCWLKRNCPRWSSQATSKKRNCTLSGSMRAGFGRHRCKRKDSVYSSRRRWLKVKNPNYTQAVGRREMFDKFHQRRCLISFCGIEKWLQNDRNGWWAPNGFLCSCAVQASPEFCRRYKRSFG